MLLKLCYFSQNSRIKEEKIEAVKIWLKPKSIQNIQVFLGFINFYRRFIKSFSKIITLFTLIFRIIITLSNLEGFLEALSKSKKKAENMNSEKTKIGRAKLIKSQTLKYSTKLKTVKIKLPRTAFKAKFFLTLKANEPFT